MRRKDFLIGLGGLAAGVPLGVIATRERQDPPPSPAPAASKAAKPASGAVSYAQAGEDLVANYFFVHLGIADITYLDIGAHDPVVINNTYFFYQRGFRGVLVEPNVDMCEKLRAVRPRDTTLEAGIGVGKPRVADYYVMTESSWSTFDKAEAEHMTKVSDGRISVREVRRMPLLNVNDVMEEHFKGKAPAFVSVDAEGWHLPILKSIDFKRFRPPVICVETLVTGELRMLPGIHAFMRSKAYVVRGGSLVNTIFVDSKLLA